MKTLQNIVLKGDDGVAHTEAETNKPLNAALLIKAMLNNVEYENREDQRRADTLYNRIAHSEKAHALELEDAEFELVLKYSYAYKPFLQGRTFAPFISELESTRDA